MRLISVVLPVYNEAGSIAACLRGLGAALATTDHEILVCYDTEEDTTLPAIAAMPDRPASVRLVRNTLGRGALNAIKTGFSAARGDVVVTSMADLSDPPELILAMADAIRGGADVVSGSRYMRGGSQHGGPWLKRTLSRISGVSLRWIAGLGTHDATSNFRAYSKAFLDSVSIESSGGFEIALELTVKAHLAGRRVSEVPSSWVDRTSGKSNFRLWRWMPSYLRWYLRAIVEPAIVWILGAAAFLYAKGQVPWSEPPAVVHRATLVTLAVLAAASVLLARRARGRTRLVDASHVAIWLHPWQGAIFAAGYFAPALAAGAAASGTLLAIAGVRVGRVLRPKTLLLAVLVALIWLARLRLPTEVPTNDLDVSWSAALARAAAMNLRAGVDYIFTFGPLAMLSTAAYHPDLFAFRIAACEGVVKLCLVLVLARAGLRLGSTLDRVLFFGLLLYPIATDSFYYLCIFAVAVGLLDRERLLTSTALLGLTIFAMLGLVKFTYLPPALLCVAVLAASASRSESWASGAAIGGAFCLLFASMWWIAGQELRDLPTWLHRSLEVSSGYSEGEASVAPPGTRALAALLFGLFAVQASLFLRRRPRSSARIAVVLVALPILWLTFKSGFVRADDHTPIFFGFTLLAPFVFALGSARSRIETSCRAACVVVSLVGLAIARPDGENPLGPLRNAANAIRGNATAIANPARQRAQCERMLASARERFALPRVTAVVGSRPIDMVSNRQALLFLNDLRWTPRPVFQGYITFTKGLMELNARFMESERAAEFILFSPETIDGHLLPMEDALTLQVIARDYGLVLVEKGYMLLRREARERSPRAPEIQLEKEIAFGEDIDLSGLGGSGHAVVFDIAYSAWGRARTLLENAPALYARIELDSGATRIGRIVPGMLRAGVVLDPYLESPTDWARWYTGSTLPRAIRVRIEPPTSPSMYADRIRVQVLRTDGLAPAPRPELATEAMFSFFKSFPVDGRAAAPVTETALRGQAVLLIRAPSELRFDVRPGAHTVSGRYGILASDWGAGHTGGAEFSAVLRVPGHEDVVVFHAHVDPTRREIDQRLKYLKVRFESPAAASLLLRTEPGPGNEPPCVDTVWSEIEID